MDFLQTQKKPFISLPHIILLSKLSFVLVLVMIIGISASIISVQAQQDYDIPQWVKNNAGWWADGIIDDESFMSGIEYLVKEKIIQID